MLRGQYGIQRGSSHWGSRQMNRDTCVCLAGGGTLVHFFLLNSREVYGYKYKTSFSGGSVQGAGNEAQPVPVANTCLLMTERHNQMMQLLQDKSDQCSLALTRSVNKPPLHGHLLWPTGLLCLCPVLCPTGMIFGEIPQPLEAQ